MYRAPRAPRKNLPLDACLPFAARLLRRLPGTLPRVLLTLLLVLTLPVTSQGGPAHDRLDHGKKKVSSAGAKRKPGSAHGKARPAKPGAAAKGRPAVKKVRLPQAVLYDTRPVAMETANTIAAAQGLDPAWVRSLIGQAQFLPAVVRAVTPPTQAGSRNWGSYRERVLSAQRIDAGAAFVREHAATLARAEREYGVPPSIIAGILGVETLYGRNMGQYRVLDTLATLAFDFPDSHPKKTQRQAYFLGELEAFVHFCAHSGYDPLTVRGSYAGAMGMGQFMPSSWLQYAVDFDGSGRIDLFNSAPDAIGSVAHYLAVHQWQPGLPTHYPLAAGALPADLEALLAPDIVPSFTPQQLAARGVLLDDAARQHPGLLALIALPMGEHAAPHHVLGTANFFTLTRYNWSSQYAMAVIELGQAVTERVKNHN